ncbi:MAG: hypothetical protein AUI64_03175 [Acidobacteria bacterium 13_1_40CM_2_64_6]|nr:MAG: hypothetical protein AUH43_11205 [Acidobacteria bacterium 13_1_40CM_65_14]OLC83344.1 MAG: hypothetical protein AUH72_04620 [Acidobacteria bacterium 13_1_40CM_4_65_8]OLD55714.1 MAG: hypothetical protein AUI64_03175 [Acidobacteria bacterium 13_1_40CM_2_64_6]OLE84336.1 MAG: hypothetical protein AUF76_03665 [Acidobacteria bacterium 13_1_20CM_2_65_9]
MVRLPNAVARSTAFVGWPRDLAAPSLPSLVHRIRRRRPACAELSAPRLQTRRALFSGSGSLVRSDGRDAAAARSIEPGNQKRTGRLPTKGKAAILIGTRGGGD